MFPVWPKVIIRGFCEKGPQKWIIVPFKPFNAHLWWVWVVLGSEWKICTFRCLLQSKKLLSSTFNRWSLKTEVATDPFLPRHSFFFMKLQFIVFFLCSALQLHFAYQRSASNISGRWWGKSVSGLRLNDRKEDFSKKYRRSSLFAVLLFAVSTICGPENRGELWITREKTQF